MCPSTTSKRLAIVGDQAGREVLPAQRQDLVARRAVVGGRACARRRAGWRRMRRGRRSRVVMRVFVVSSVARSVRRQSCDDRPVRLGPAVAEELPGVADLADQVEVEVGDHDVVAVAAADGEHLAARVAEVALAVELADPPGLLEAGPVDRADEVAVGDRVRRLLELPEVFGQPGDRRRRVEDDLRPVQAEAAGPFGEVAVVADVDADLADPGVEDRVAEVAGPEVELLPEARGRSAGCASCGTCRGSGRRRRSPPPCCSRRPVSSSS